MLKLYMYCNEIKSLKIKEMIYWVKYKIKSDFHKNKKETKKGKNKKKIEWRDGEEKRGRSCVLQITL